VEAISRYSWEDGKTWVSVIVEMDGLEELGSDCLTVEHDRKHVRLTVVFPGGKIRRLDLAELLWEIQGVEIEPVFTLGVVILKLLKVEKRRWVLLSDQVGASVEMAERGGLDEYALKEIEGMMAEAEKRAPQSLGILREVRQAVIQIGVRKLCPCHKELVGAWGIIDDWKDISRSSAKGGGNNDTAASGLNKEHWIAVKRARRANGKTT